VLERYFMIWQRGSTVAREIRGGLVTFVTMAYIVVLNPLVIGSFSADAPSAKRDISGAILPVPQVAAVTALVAGVLTLAMGLIVNYPFAMATGLGLNSFVAAIATGIGLFICSSDSSTRDLCAGCPTLPVVPSRSSWEWAAASRPGRPRSSWWGC
jgi:xanthine/uracil/vitamin C permease (AzgA family)